MDFDLKPRKRDPNFTAFEKSLLTQLVKQFPIILTKLTDGESIRKKKQAWLNLTQEFNSKIDGHKRDTVTLKRAWDNQKASMKKAIACKEGNTVRTVGRPAAPSPTPEDSMTMVEAAPVMTSEASNDYDSDRVKLEVVTPPSVSVDVDIEEMEEEASENLSSEDEPIIKNRGLPLLPPTNNTENYIRVTASNDIRNFSRNCSPTDYIRQEAIMRMKLFEDKRKIEMQILQKQLEAENLRRDTEEINKEAARYLLQHNILQYEKAKLELERLKKCDK